MGSNLNPYLNFDGRTREAMEFYRDVLGGELNLNTFGEFGMEGEGSEGVMHAQLETPAGFVLMASDLAPGSPAPTPGDPMVSISLSGDDEPGLRRYWDGLAQGGQVTMPLEQQMWGDVFGMVTDRFGTQWMVNITRPQG